jgi:hypothetical protein
MANKTNLVLEVILMRNLWGCQCRGMIYGDDYRQVIADSVNSEVQAT